MAKVEHITEGPIFSTIVKLAWPVVAAMFLESALIMTDYFWVGFLGTPQQDALTSSIIVTWTMFATSAIIVTGLTAVVARAAGARREDDAAYAGMQGIQMAIGIGITIAISGFILTPGILRFMNASPQVVKLGIPYLRIFFSGIILFFINDALGSIFRASGNTKTPTLAFAIGTGLNIVLDPFFIFGWGPFPELGMAGAATATIISISVTFLTFIFLLLRKRLDFSLSAWYRTKPDIKTMLKIFKIGIPISTQNLVFVVVYWFIIQIVHEFGQAAGAAMGVGNRWESLSFLIVFGLSTAVSTMVGQNLGAGQPSRAAKSTWATIGLAIGETFIVSVLFISIPHLLAGIFTSDPAVIEISIDYLVILALSQVFMAVEIILEGAFSGAGDTIPPMLVSIPGSISRLPLAYLLCFTFDIGINGVWWTLTITSFVKAIILLLWFRRGKWKNKKL